MPLASPNPNPNTLPTALGEKTLDKWGGVLPSDSADEREKKRSKAATELRELELTLTTTNPTTTTKHPTAAPAYSSPPHITRTPLPPTHRQPQASARSERGNGSGGLARARHGMQSYASL